VEVDLWLHTDETREAVVSLDMVEDCLHKVLSNVHYWKWVVIALHNALQGYMVLALRGSNSLNVLKEQSRKKWVEAWERDDKVMPRRELDTFLNLYNKIQTGKKCYDDGIKRGHIFHRGPYDLMLMYVHSKPFAPSCTQTESVKMLNFLRNDFVHFLPKGWSLGVGGLPRIVNDCVDIIEFLAFECGNILWHEKELETKTKELIAQIRGSLDLLKPK